MYTVGDIPMKYRERLQSMLEAFHASLYIQDQCQKIQRTADEYQVVADGAAGSEEKASQDIPRNTRVILIR